MLGGHKFIHLLVSLNGRGPSRFFSLSGSFDNQLPIPSRISDVLFPFFLSTGCNVPNAKILLHRRRQMRTRNRPILISHLAAAAAAAAKSEERKRFIPSTSKRLARERDAFPGWPGLPPGPIGQRDVIGHA